MIPPGFRRCSAIKRPSTRQRPAGTDFDTQPMPIRRRTRSSLRAMRARAATNVAVRAEPRGIGTSRARDPLAREVKLLGSLLGQVIVEQEGRDAFELVERVRRTTISIKRGTAGVDAREKLASDLAALDERQAEVLIRAFSLYFQITNLAEEKQRVRTLRRRQRAAPNGMLAESLAAAISELRSAGMSSIEISRTRRQPPGRPSAHRSPDRGAAEDSAGGAAAGLPATGQPRRRAADTSRGCGYPPQAARADLGAVADRAGKGARPQPAGRGAERAGAVRRDPVRRGPAPVPGTRHGVDGASW